VFITALMFRLQMMSLLEVLPEADPTAVVPLKQTLKAWRPALGEQAFFLPHRHPATGPGFLDADD
jgi:hypothetical protein